MPVTRPTVASLALIAGLSLGATGCALPEADGNDEVPPAAALTFAYEARGGEGYIDQTVTITNSGDAAAAPDLDFVPVAADGSDLADVEVVTAFGSDEGVQVVPAYTEVIEVLKFKGPGRDEVADVRVEVAATNPLTEEVPTANDLAVRRIDITGRKARSGALARVTVRNEYDVPITVAIVGLEYAEAAPGDPQHFRRVSELAGPLVIAPGEKARVKLDATYQTRFFGSVKAYLTR